VRYAGVEPNSADWAAVANREMPGGAPHELPLDGFVLWGSVERVNNTLGGALNAFNEKLVAMHPRSPLFLSLAEHRSVPRDRRGHSDTAVASGVEVPAEPASDQTPERSVATVAWRGHVKQVADDRSGQCDGSRILDFWAQNTLGPPPSNTLQRLEACWRPAGGGALRCVDAARDPTLARAVLVIPEAEASAGTLLWRVREERRAAEGGNAKRRSRWVNVSPLSRYTYGATRSSATEPTVPGEAPGLQNLLNGFVTERSDAVSPRPLVLATVEAGAENPAVMAWLSDLVPELSWATASSTQRKPGPATASRHVFERHRWADEAFALVPDYSPARSRPPQIERFYLEEALRGHAARVRRARKLDRDLDLWRRLACATQAGGKAPPMIGSARVTCARPRDLAAHLAGFEPRRALEAIVSSDPGVPICVAVH